MDLELIQEVIEWRGPAPYHFVWVPEADAAVIAEVAAAVTYGWGMVPVQARVGDTTWATSLWPREGRYVVPLKDAVRRVEGIGLGDVVTVRLHLSL